MKRIFAGIVICLMLAGCAGISLGVKTPEIEKAAKIAGVLVANNNPELVKAALPYAKGLLVSAQQGKVDQSMISDALNALANGITADTNVLLAIGVAVEMLDVEIQVGKVDDKLVLALSGFITGLEGL